PIMERSASAGACGTAHDGFRCALPILHPRDRGRPARPCCAEENRPIPATTCFTPYHNGLTYQYVGLRAVRFLRPACAGRCADRMWEDFNVPQSLSGSGGVRDCRGGVGPSRVRCRCAHRWRLQFGQPGLAYVLGPAIDVDGAINVDHAAYDDAT